MSVTRRSALAGLLVAPITKPARAGTPPRVVALDWSLASTLLALGVTPVGVAEPALYRDWVGAPALPLEVRAVGLRLEPNLELLAALKPDLILGNPLGRAIRPLLERIAPVLHYDLYTREGRPLARARAMTGDLGRRLRREAEAEALWAGAERGFEAAGRALAHQGRRRLLLASFIDARHVNVYGRNSLFGAVLERLGLVNAWEKPTSDWGVAVAAIQDLAALPDADLVIVEPIPADAALSLSRPGLWTALLKARAGAVARLPPVWAFGDVVAAARFAGLLADRLGTGAT